MRKAAVQKNPRGFQISRTDSVPAPVRGWNTRDSLAAMDEKDAVTLTNFFCMPSSVMLRRGYANHVTGISGQVESLMSWQSGTTKKLFAANTSALYDVTSAGAVGASVQSGLTNGRWQHVVTQIAGTGYLYAVNGADKPRLYDGASWVAVDGVSTPAITGVTTTSLIHVNVFKNRLWFVEKEKLKVWYLPVDSVGGAANSIDFGTVFRRGGYLMAMGTWTLDAGQGMDDYAVFLTSEGEIAVYAGTDPSSATTWALRGVYYVGAPIGRRCFTKYAGDLALICRDGLVPLSKGLMSSRVNTSIALTDRIQPTVSAATTTYGGNFGWQAITFPSENMLILNVPVSTGSQEQYVMNTISMAWSRFTGWAANCWEIHSDEIYFGGNGVVCKAWSTGADNGAAVNGEVLQAFNYFGSKTLKSWRMVRPIFSSDGPFGVSFGLDADFTSNEPTGVPSFSSTTAGVWDSGTWDSAIWGGGLSTAKDWQSVYTMGFCGAPHLKISSRSSYIYWSSTDHVLENGGVL